MRSAPAWIVLCATGASALAATVASAQQDMMPYEEEIEAEGKPPVTAQPPSAAIDDANVQPPVTSPAAVQANALLMEQLLTTATKKTIREQKFGAAYGITGGAILLGLGAWRISEREAQSQFSRGLGIMFMTLGAADLTTGVFAATRVSHEKRRLERWQKAQKDGITDLELARAEGELLASAETREGERLLIRWNGLTHALAGVAVLSLAPIPDISRTDKVSAWIVGGIFVATGFAAFGMSFRPTPSEKAWNEYQAKRMGTSMRQLSFRVTPAVSRYSFGLGMTGTF